MANLIQADGIGNPEPIWREWLTEAPAHRDGRLEQPKPGMWRVVLGSDAFGSRPKLPLTLIGGYRFRKHHFLHVWCADADIRRQALLHRGRGLATMPDVATAGQLQDRVDQLAASLDVATVTVAELRQHARREGDATCVDRLDALPA